MALSLATCSGWASVNSDRQLVPKLETGLHALDGIPESGDSLNVLVER